MEKADDAPATPVLFVDSDTLADARKKPGTIERYLGFHDLLDGRIELVPSPGQTDGDAPRS